MLIGNFEDRNSCVAAMEASEKLLKKCGVFDLKGFTLGFVEKMCKKGSPCPLLVFLYACLGIHRYNFLKGTKFEPSRVKKYVMSTHAAVASYYITLEAKEPGSSSTKTFQTKVSETSFGEFILGCSIARIRGETSDEQGKVYVPGQGTYLLGKHLPEWPQENPFEKYYLVKKSELEDKDHWIRLYLELAVATTDRYRVVPKDYEEMEIVDVAIDEGLNAKNATFYIRFNDFYTAQLGKNVVDRVAIVKRRFDEDTELFSLEGQILSTQEVIPKKP